MSRRRLGGALVMLGVLLVVVGVWRGEAGVVFGKAATLCLECIGIG